MNQRTALITGVGGGIGWATALHFMDHGWKVIGVDRKPLTETLPKGNTFIQADVSDANALARW